MVSDRLPALASQGMGIRPHSAMNLAVSNLFWQMECGWARPVLVSSENENLWAAGTEVWRLFVKILFAVSL